MESVSPAYSRLARLTLVLFALNAALQVFDGVVTYIGCSIGMVEGNPMVAYAMECFGLGLGLALTKAAALAFLAALWLLRANRLVPAALVVTASIYLAFSAVPWSISLLNVARV
jgi:hypothetical protein